MSFHMPIQFQGILSTIGLLDVLDILIVALILYKLYMMLQDTRAITLVKGLLVLLGLALVCNWLSLHVIYWLLQQTLTLLVNELDKAVMLLSSRKIGALLVFEREMGLNDISATGVQIDGLITADFLMNVFIPNTPLHDGAAVIRGKRLIAAGCLLPLTENRTLSTELGTRHRAAIGLSEQCDALIVVVSEETGTVSVAENGRLVRRLSSEHLKAYLRPIFTPKTAGFKDMVLNWRKGK